MRSSRASLTVVLLGLGVFAALVAGCSADSTPAPPLPPPPGPATPDLLVQEFQTAYEAMDAAEYARLLDTDFVMPLQAWAAASYPDLGPALERAENLRIHERLFLGQAVTDPNQVVVPAVQAIAYQTLARSGDWVAGTEQAGYPGTVSAPYDVVMLLDREGTHSTLKVMGSLRFHVALRDTTVNGVDGTYCRLRAITDLTMDTLAASGKATETISLGRLLGAWR